MRLFGSLGSVERGRNTVFNSGLVGEGWERGEGGSGLSVAGTHVVHGVITVNLDAVSGGRYPHKGSFVFWQGIGPYKETACDHLFKFRNYL